MKILLMGPQGCGKGTIGKMLSEKLGIPLVSVGDILRSIPPEHPRYQELQDAMNEGDLAPQDLVADLLKEKIKNLDTEDAFILDGWCRAMIDLKYFDPNPNKVIVLNISRETSLKRLSGRRMCSTDGKIYNIYTLPKEELEKCEGELIQRKDDTPEAINERLDIYYSETQEVIDKFKQEGKVIEIDGEPTPDEVFDSVLESLDIK